MKKVVMSPLSQLKDQEPSNFNEETLRDLIKKEVQKALQRTRGKNGA
jgi:hypothetical protein